MVSLCGPWIVRHSLDGKADAAISPLLSIQLLAQLDAAAAEAFVSA